ncbi:MAG: 3-isopropylmalate dehydrogenase [Planctomycetota bacterium]|nr:3-isopropylmalate dehydrogenase [Planctomycetota bacterium]
MRIAVIGGDGTGPEVVAEGLKVLKAASDKVGFDYKTKDFNVSGDRYLADGGDPAEPSIPVIHEEEIEELKTFDAIYLGAVGHPDVAPGILEKGLLLRLRFALDQYVNLRPVTLYPGVPCPLVGKGPDDIDFVVVRENTEGLYTGMGGIQYKDTPNEVATQIMCNTRRGVERAIRYAFELCRRRNDRKHLTLVAKNNVLTFAHDLWWRAFNEVASEYADIETDYNHVDACCMWFVKNPEFYDTIVVCNMFGDIITDLGAIIQGGMGVAAGGNINPAGVSMFEPIGGSAPKYTGKNVINPIAAIAAMAMLLRETGQNTGDDELAEAGRRVESAIRSVTPKMKSQSAGKMGFTTTEVGDLVAEAVEKTE